MRLGYNTVELRSLLVLLFVFVGNAQIQGIDLTLFFLLPAFLFLQPISLWKFRKSTIWIIVFLTMILLGCFVQTVSLDIPYFENYYIWPLKAAFLFVFLASGNQLNFPIGNIVILALICLFLIAVGRIENGRLVSVFGPNMLYRIFGFLLAFSAALIFVSRGMAKVAALICMAIGTFATLLTGSSGAVVVLAILMLITIYRLSRIGFAVFLVFIAYLSIRFSNLVSTVGLGSSFPSFLSRIFYKSSQISDNPRLNGWGDLLTSPFAILGSSYDDYANIWFFGFQYPHNIFVELYIYHGMFGIIISGFMIVGAILFIPRILKGDVAGLVFIVMLVASCLSGDLSDNYGVIGLLGGLFWKDVSRNHDSPNLALR